MKLSVLMITYNQEKFIKQAMESVLMQTTNFEYELVIGEDCSTDKTREVLIEYQKKYPDKIKLLLREKNLGITSNFIQTANACKGEYIAICEGDDYWTDPQKLQKQVKFLDANPDFVMCTHEVLVKYEDKSKDDESFKHLERDIFYIEDVIESRLFVTNSLVFRKKYILKLPSWFENVISADRALLILVAANGKIKYMNEIMGVYRKHSGGISSYGDVEKIFLSDIFMFEKVDSYFNFRYKKLVQEVIFDRHRQMLDYYIARNDKHKSCPFYLKCLTLAIEAKKWCPMFFVYNFYGIFIPEKAKMLYRRIKKVGGHDRKEPEVR